MSIDADRVRLLLPHFRWIVEGRLAGVSRPGTDEAMALLHALGISAIISLTEELLPPNLLPRWDMRALHIPITDYTAPTIAQVERAIAAIDGFLSRGEVVAVHCGAGLGRTGTIAACYLVSQGIPAAQTIVAVRTQQPGSIETPEQENAVALYEWHLRHR